MPEVQRTLGNEREGGYTFRAKAPCIDGTLNDQEVLERFIAHRKGTCPCVKTVPTKDLVIVTLDCPHCGFQHVEKGNFARFNHKDHLCYNCGKRFLTETPVVGGLHGAKMETMKP